MHEKIRALREQRGYSQEELGKMIGYTSRTTMSKVELGLIDPPQSKIKALARALGVSIMDLLFDDDYSEDIPPIDEPMFERDGMRILFDAAKGTSDETLQKAISYIEFLKEQEQKK